MKNLYIVGASGCGREVLNIIKDIHAIRGVQWNIVGFLDDDFRHWIASIVTIRSLVPSKIIFRRQMMFWRWGSQSTNQRKNSCDAESKRGGFSKYHSSLCGLGAGQKRGIKS